MSFHLDSFDNLHRFLERIINLFSDKNVDELFFNGASVVFVKSGCSVRKVRSVFENNIDMTDFLVEFAASQQVRLDPIIGFAGGELIDPPGRWHVVLPPLSRDGPIFCLRRHRFEILRLQDFLFADAVKLDLIRHISLGCPLLIVGSTGSGKTSFLSSLLKEFAIDKRVVIIESLPELRQLGSNWVRLLERVATRNGVAAITSETLLAQALRLNPDCIVIGEIRAGEARTFIEAARTGHNGVVATMHSGSVEEAVSRLQTLAGGLELPRDLGILRLTRSIVAEVAEFTQVGR